MTELNHIVQGRNIEPVMFAEGFEHIIDVAKGGYNSFKGGTTFITALDGVVNTFQAHYKPDYRINFYTPEEIKEGQYKVEVISYGEKSTSLPRSADVGTYINLLEKWDDGKFHVVSSLKSDTPLNLTGLGKDSLTAYFIDETRITLSSGTGQKIDIKPELSHFRTIKEAEGNEHFQYVLAKRKFGNAIEMSSEIADAAVKLKYDGSHTLSAEQEKALVDAAKQAQSAEGKSAERK